MDKNHYLNCRDGKFNSTSKADLDALFSNLRAQAATKLVIHFHGGLVGEASGMSVATNLLPVYEAAGAYPVFFVWESGLLDAIEKNVAKIGNEAIFRRLVQRLAQFALGRLSTTDADRAVGLGLPALLDVREQINVATSEPFAGSDVSQLDAKVTESEKDQLAHAIRGDAVIQRQSAAILGSLVQTPTGTRSVASVDAVETLMSQSVLDELQADAQRLGDRGLVSTAFFVKKAIEIFAAVLGRYADNRHHGLYPTIVEEVLRKLYIDKAGKILWRTMKDDTADAFTSDPNVYAGTAFLAGLRDLPRPIEITLVGHSAGAIYASEFIRHSDEFLPPAVQFNVILLAPACTFDVLAETLKNHHDRIANVRVFAMKDELEKQDQMLGVVYPRSLLYFVSGLLESEPDFPIVGMQRFYTGNPPFDTASFPTIAQVKDFLAETPNRQAWSDQASPNGCITSSRKHGDFDNDPSTLASLGFILSMGF